MSKQEILSEGRVTLAKMLTLRWIATHAKQIFYAVCSMMALAIFLFSFSKKFISNPVSDYLKVQTAFTNWASKEAHDKDLFKELSVPLSRHPELAARFGTLIAQRLLTLGETQLAQEYADAAFQRTKTLLSPYHARFAENTLCISQGRLPDALKTAHQLKREMENDEKMWKEKKETARILYAYNLLRIAALEREAGSKEGERAAWEEILSSAGWASRPRHPKTYDPEAFQRLSANFQSGDISLIEYINKRLIQLN
jgi:hypothetical protein